MHLYYLKTFSKPVLISVTSQLNGKQERKLKSTYFSDWKIRINESKTEAIIYDYAKKNEE